MDLARLYGCVGICCKAIKFSGSYTLSKKRGRNHQYITLKVYTRLASVNQEIDVYNHLSTIQSSHAGQSCLRPVIDSFEISNPDGHGAHTCLLHPPLGISLDQLTSLLPSKVMSSNMVKTTIRNILAALDFLHTEAHIIHTGL